MYYLYFKVLLDFLNIEQYVSFTWQSCSGLQIEKLELKICFNKWKRNCFAVRMEWFYITFKVCNMSRLDDKLAS